MKYTIWDKVTSIYGLDAETILNADEALKYDDVIIITDKFGEIIYLDTKKALARKYEIESTDPHEVARGVIDKLIHPEKIEFVEIQRIDSDKSIIESIKKAEDAIDYVLEELNETGTKENEYEEPECKINKIDTSDDVHKDESITLILENVTFEMKDGVLPDYKILKDAYPDEHDLKVFRSEAHIDNTTISTPVVEVYEYERYILAKTKAGQNIFIDKTVVNKCHTNVTEYDRRLGDIGKQRVKYVTIHVECELGTADLFERRNSVFVVL